MHSRIAGGVAVLVLAAVPASAQGRGPQVVTGISLASFGIYAAVSDRDCDIHPQTTLLDGQCTWRNSSGRLVGVPPELPREQLAGGLFVAGIGGLMASGAWEPSRAVDTIFTAGAGFILLAVAWDDTLPRGTVHQDTSDGRRLSTCPAPFGSHGYGGYGDDSWDPCTHTSFSRIHTTWSGIAALGLAAGRLLWRDGPPPVSLDMRLGGIRVSKTIAF